MKVHYKTSKLTFEIEGSTQAELFKQIAEVNEIFQDESCGECGNADTRFVVRTNKDGDDYYERHCSKCGSRLSYGQYKTPKGGLFVKRKTADGKFDTKNKGWNKYVPVKPESEGVKKK